MAVCSLLPKSFPLLLCRDFIFTHLYHFHFCTGHLKSKFSVCKKCTILLNIKIRWERVCIANPHMYRYSIFLLTASNRIIFYFRQETTFFLFSQYNFKHCRFGRIHRKACFHPWLLIVLKKQKKNFRRITSYSFTPEQSALLFL